VALAHEHDVDLRTLDRQYLRQAAWFAGVRADLLRRVGVRGKRRVLDLGCGTGVVTAELARRCGGRVIALDACSEPLGLEPGRFAGAQRLVAAAEALPFPDASFDLVFTQMLWLWIAAPSIVAAEARRVLKPGCELLVVAEPDYGGRIEHPHGEGLGPRMGAALRALGADPEIGRKMSGILQAQGFRVEAGVHPSVLRSDDLVSAWQEERAFLASLGDRGATDGPAAAFLFMPYFWFLARKPQ
jgi:SAM-dependent methyltransferase